MENEGTQLRRSKSLLKWVAAAGVFAVMAPPLAYAAVQEVKVTNTPLPVKGTADVGQQGVFGTRPVKDTIRNQEVPGAFLGAGDCNNADNQLGNAQASNIVIPADGGRTVITGILITGRSPLPGESAYSAPNGAVYVNTDAVPSPLGGNANLLEAVVTPDQPNVAIDLGPGLALTSPLHFEGRAPGGGDNGDCQFVVLGYARTSALAD